MTLAVMLAEQKCNYYFLILCYKVPGPLTMGDKWTFCKPQASLEWIYSQSNYSFYRGVKTWFLVGKLDF